MNERVPRSFPKRFPIFQLPNRPMIVSIATGAIARSTSGRLARDAAVVSHPALLVWAAEEVLDGANWLRRLCGLAGGGYAIAGLIEQASR